MMSKKMLEIETIKLAHTKEGQISIAHIEEPYGDFSSPVVSVGITLEGSDIDWKVHLPYENLDAVIKALEKARDLTEKLPHHDKHTLDLDGDIGGGE
jgi:hypothetical protein